MRKIVFIFTIFLYILNISDVNAFDKSLKIYDYAQVLSSEEEQELKNNADEFIEKYNMDMVLVSVKHHEKSTTKSYAEDFYDFNDFGLNETKDGILFVIDFTFGYRDIYILTTGEAIRLFDDYRIESMKDNIESVSDKKYYYWFLSFVNDASHFASLGISSSNENTYINEQGDYILFSQNKKSINWLIIILLSLIVPSIIILVLSKKHKMIKKSVNARQYIKKVNITTRNDQFLTTHTSSIRINNDNINSGGSSVSRGSSGTMHGGGGRRL